MSPNLTAAFLGDISRCLFSYVLLHAVAISFAAFILSSNYIATHLHTWIFFVVLACFILLVTTPYWGNIYVC